VSGVDIHSNVPRTAYETTLVPKLKSILFVKNQLLHIHYKSEQCSPIGFVAHKAHGEQCIRLQDLHQ
jgi:hypothetical protein